MPGWFKAASFFKIAALVTFLAGGFIWAAGCGPPPEEKQVHGSLDKIFPRAQGWDYSILDEAWEKAKEFGATSLIILKDGKLVGEWGETAKRTSSHSVRKSLMSGLYGIAVDKGFISLDVTMADLGIDDKPPSLTPEEKKAKVRHLLTSSSGVYHPAAAESQQMKKMRPARGSFAPGQNFYYNNWDFNVLGTIFEKETGLKIGRAFEDWIARPIGMLDFRPQDVHYGLDPVSIHKSYPFYISARDLALYGQLFVQNGKWKGKRIIPDKWVTQSTSKLVKLRNDRGYGYMWWRTGRRDAYYASGFGGQYLVVLPKEGMVIVSRVDSGSPGAERKKWLESGKKMKLLDLLKVYLVVQDAKP